MLAETIEDPVDMIPTCYPCLLLYSPWTNVLTCYITIITSTKSKSKAVHENLEVWTIIILKIIILKKTLLSHILEIHCCIVGTFCCSCKCKMQM